LPYSINLVPAEAAALLKPNWGEPELGLVALTLYVDVRRLIAVVCIEEESVWPISQNGRHG